MMSADRLLDSMGLVVAKLLHRLFFRLSQIPTRALIQTLLLMKRPDPLDRLSAPAVS